MSFQSDAAKTPTDDWRVRSALKPKEHYSVDDFPVGKLIVSESRVAYGTGRTGYALCEVIDCYVAKSLRWRSDGLAIHARVVATHDDFLGYMLGHVVQLGLASRGSWHSDNGLRVTTIPPKEMFPERTRA